MTRVVTLACVITLAACGRVEFDARGDGGDGDDGTSDGNADADTTLFCDRPRVPAPTVCADFDRGQPIMTGFTSFVADGVGRIGQANGVNTSPGSLVSTLDAQVNTGAISHASLVYKPSGQPSRVTLTADVFIADPPGADYEVSEIFIANSPTNYDWDVNVGTGGSATFFEELAVPTTMTYDSQNIPLAPLAVSAWHTITVRMDVAARTRELDIDGTMLVSGPTAYAIVPGPITVDVGIVWSSGVTPPVSVYVDNVLIYVE